MKPALSVILSAYNAEKYIREAIESILTQTFPYFELIIADDGSSDNTKKIIDTFKDPRIQIKHNHVNQGKVPTVNRLVEIAQGKFITIHDADDFSEPNRFQIAIDFLEKNTHLAMIGTSFRQHIGKKSKVIHMPTDFDLIKKSLPYKSQFHGPTIFFRREILKDTHGLFRYFKWGEDIDFTCRVVEKFRSVNLDIPLYNYRIHERSITKSLDMVTPDRLINDKLRVFLFEQRQENGTDCLMEQQPNLLEQEKQKLLRKYKSEPSLVYWEHSQKMLYYNLYNVAIKAALKGCMVSFSIKNFKNLLFVVIKSIFK